MAKLEPKIERHVGHMSNIRAFVDDIVSPLKMHVLRTGYSRSLILQQLQSLELATLLFEKNAIKNQIKHRLQVFNQILKTTRRPVYKNRDSLQTQQ